MIDLTARQVQILRAIIEEFIDTAEPVGSETIDKKFNIGVSPATIRNEMVYLQRQGYIKKSHSSAGRIPTPLAMKLYVNELMKEKELTVADEVSAKEKIWNSRADQDELLSQIAKVLAEKTHSLALTMDDQHIYSAGYANLLNMPEFYDISVMRHVLQLIEEQQLLEDLFSASQSENTVQVIYGQDMGNKYLEPVGLIHTSVSIDGHNCRVAVLGSARFDYSYIYPLLKYMKTLVHEIVE